MSMTTKSSAWSGTSRSTDLGSIPLLSRDRRCHHAGRPGCYFCVKRPRFSWTRIKGESNGQGSGGNGSVEASDASRRIGTDGGRPESVPTPRWLGRGSWGRGSGGARAASGTSCCDCCAASRSTPCRVRSGSRSIAWRSGWMPKHRPVAAEVVALIVATSASPKGGAAPRPGPARGAARSPSTAPRCDASPR